MTSWINKEELISKIGKRLTDTDRCLSQLKYKLRDYHRTESVPLWLYHKLHWETTIHSIICILPIQKTEVWTANHHETWRSSDDSLLTIWLNSLLCWRLRNRYENDYKHIYKAGRNSCSHTRLRMQLKEIMTILMQLNQLNLKENICKFSIFIVYILSYNLYIF